MSGGGIVQPRAELAASQDLQNAFGVGARPVGSQRFTSSLLAIASGQAGCILLAAFTEFCYARLLGPGPRGLISLCLMAASFGALVGSLGSEATVVYWIARAKGRKSTWFPAIALWVMTGSVVAVLAWGLLYWKWNPAFLKGMTSRLALIVLVTIPVTVLFSMQMAMFAGEQRFRVRSLIALANRILCLVCFLGLFLVFGPRVETGVVGNLVGLAASIGIGVFFLWDYVRAAWKVVEARESLVPTMVYGLRGHLGNLASFFSYRLDVFVVNYFLDVTQVGLYSLGVLISEALWQMPAVVSTALFPRTARTVEAGANEFTCMVLRQMFLLTVVAAVLVALASPWAIPLVFGARFAASVAVVWWILPGTVALALGKIIAADLSGRGLNQHLPISAVIGMVLTLVFDLLLIPRMGIQGAALASSIAYVAASAYLFVVIRRALGRSLSVLLVPTRGEFLAYGRLWVTVRAGLAGLKN